MMMRWAGVAASWWIPTGYLTRWLGYDFMCSLSPQHGQVACSSFAFPARSLLPNGSSSFSRATMCRSYYRLSTCIYVSW
ncbi:hypothetical protein B0T22DRAFT_470418 [Podospora appendiculata]|uniref:Uncharacterized protein n=1 Tax=Podospora appendiculata TaxID=314037 RepID=A0AAE1C7V3_9PEZI|nr:hypothetical protein B0T22DRAFT_470418 [Podospora appendiculata]